MKNNLVYHLDSDFLTSLLKSQLKIKDSKNNYKKMKNNLKVYKIKIIHKNCIK